MCGLLVVAEVSSVGDAYDLLPGNSATMCLIRAGTLKDFSLKGTAGTMDFVVPGNIDVISALENDFHDFYDFLFS